MTDRNDLPPSLSVEPVHVTYLEGSGPILIAPEITVEDGDSTINVISSCQVELKRDACDVCDSERVFVQLPPDASVMITSTNFTNGSQFVTIAGDEDDHTYQAILSTLSYDNMADEPSEENRTVTISCHDGSFTSNSVAIDISIATIDEFCPIVSAASTNFNYTEGSGVLNVGEMAGLVVTDGDSPSNQVVSQVEISLQGIIDIGEESIFIGETLGLSMSVEYVNSTSDDGGSDMADEEPEMALLVIAGRNGEKN